MPPLSQHQRFCVILNWPVVRKLWGNFLLIFLGLRILKIAYWTSIKILSLSDNIDLLDSIKIIIPKFQKFYKVEVQYFRTYNFYRSPL